MDESQGDFSNLSPEERLNLLEVQQERELRMESEVSGVSLLKMAEEAAEAGDIDEIFACVTADWKRIPEARLPESPTPEDIQRFLEAIKPHRAIIKRVLDVTQDQLKQKQEVFQKAVNGDPDAAKQLRDKIAFENQKDVFIKQLRAHRDAIEAGKEPPSITAEPPSMVLPTTKPK